MNEDKYLEKQSKTMGESAFMKKLLKKRLNQKGLTLIELLAVIVILAIVAAIAIPAIGNVIENSRFDAVKADAVNVLNGANLYKNSGSASATSISVGDLKTAGYIENAGKIPDAATVNLATPVKLTHTSAIPYSGSSKTITFTGASIEGINKAVKADTVTVNQ